MSRTTKYEYLHVLQGHYGTHGWEDLTASESRSEVRSWLIDYRTNEGGRYRVIQRRVSREQLADINKWEGKETTP